MSLFFPSIYAPYHFLAACVTHVHISLNNSHVFRNLRDVDFALSCRDDLTIKTEIAIN